MFRRRPGKRFLCALCVAVELTASAYLCTGQIPAASAATNAAETPMSKAQRICLQTEAQFRRDHDPTKAWNGFVAATKIDPNYAPAYFNLGVLAEVEKKWKDAQDYFNRYEKLAPKGPDAGRAREQAELLNRYISGEMTLEDVKRNDYDAEIQRARTLLAAGFYREAIADAGQAQAMDSSRWEAYAVVSLCMLRQHKTSEAAEMRDQAMARVPADKRDQLLGVLSPPAAAETQK